MSDVHGGDDHQIDRLANRGCASGEDDISVEGVLGAEERVVGNHAEAEMDEARRHTDGVALEAAGLPCPVRSGGSIITIELKIQGSARNAASNGMITHQFNNRLRKYVPTRVQLSAENIPRRGLR